MTYTYSYSGADCKAYAWFEGAEGIYEKASEKKTSIETKSETRYEKKYPNMEKPTEPVLPSPAPLDPGPFNQDLPVLETLDYLPNSSELNSICNTIISKLDEIFYQNYEIQKEEIEKLITLFQTSFRIDYINDTLFSRVEELRTSPNVSAYISILSEILNLLIAAKESPNPRRGDLLNQSILLLDNEIKIIDFESENLLIYNFNEEMQRIYDEELISYNALSADYLSKKEKYEADKAKFVTDMKNYTDQLKSYKIKYAKFMEMKQVTTEIKITRDEGVALFEWLNNPVHLSSLATISVSIHDAKAPVRRLGHVGVSGFTKAIRTIAGTMVFLIIEDHPLRSLIAKDPSNIDLNYYYYSLDQEKGRGSLIGKTDTSFFGTSKLSSLISKFNLMLKYQTEVYKEKENNFGGASMIIKGIEITGESIVTSVNDMVTEVVIQFVAEDVVMFRASKTDIEETIKELPSMQKAKREIREVIKVEEKDVPSNRIFPEVNR